MRSIGFYSVSTGLLIVVAIAAQELPWFLKGESAPEVTSPPPLEHGEVPSPQDYRRGRLLSEAAKTFVGTDYRLGGTDSSGIDCSGLVYAAARQAGFAVHRTTTRRMMTDYKEAPNQLRQGDLPLFSHNGSTVAHVGIWDDPDNKKMIHASSSKGVIISEVNKYYWLPRLVVSKELP